MKRVWKRKWLVIAAAVTVFLSIGAVAWAATGEDTGVAGETGTAVGVGLMATGSEDGSGPGGPGAAMRQAAREKIQQWRKLHARLLEELRDDMTAEDQALYDQLVATAQEQREALQKARQELSETLGQLRELGKKYLE